MPTLDDMPLLESFTGSTGATGSNAANLVSGDDLVTIYDVSEQKAKTITVSQLRLALISLDIGIGATGATGATGPTGPTGPTGA